MDSQILQQIVAIEVERLRGGAPIRASVSEGVVTLTGAVQDDGRRILIEQELRRLPEVLDVHNHLHVPTPTGDLRTQFLTLLEREDVPAAGLKIEAEGGAVVLSGRAASWFERLAWTLPSIGSVENRITLPPGAAEPDVDGAGNLLA